MWREAMDLAANPRELCFRHCMLDAVGDRAIECLLELLQKTTQPRGGEGGAPGAGQDSHVNLRKLPATAPSRDGRRMLLATRQSARRRAGAPSAIGGLVLATRAIGLSAVLVERLQLKQIFAVLAHVARHV